MRRSFSLLLTFTTIILLPGFAAAMTPPADQRPDGTFSFVEDGRSMQSRMKIVVVIRVSSNAGLIRLRVRNSHEKEYICRQHAASSNVTFEVPQEKLPVGRYFADAWMPDGQRRVLDWFTAELDVYDPQGIVSLAAEKPYVPLSSL